MRPRDFAERRGDPAEEGRELGPGRGPGPVEEDDPVDAPNREDGRGRGVRHVPGGRREEAAVRGQLLRRGGIRCVRAHGGEGVRPSDGGGGGGEDEGDGGAGQGSEARWGRGRVGPTARAGVRAEIAGAEDGRRPSVGACDRLHGQ